MIKNKHLLDDRSVDFFFFPIQNTNVPLNQLCVLAIYTYT